MEIDGSGSVEMELGGSIPVTDVKDEFNLNPEKEESGEIMEVSLVFNENDSSNSGDSESVGFNAVRTENRTKNSLGLGLRRLQGFRDNLDETKQGFYILIFVRTVKKIFNTVLGLRKRVGLLLGLLILFVFQLFDIDGDHRISATFSVAIVMALWWILEVVPLAVTAMLPLFLFPILGVETGSVISTKYANSTIFTFLGGFIVAKAMERWRLHHRIALKICILFGAWPKFLLLGMMMTTWFLSMWISNTAATMTMVTNAIAVSEQLEIAFSSDARGGGKMYSRGLFLGIAYSASIGGTATLIGTPPNLALVQIMKILYPDSPEITFGQWIIWGLPVAFCFLILLWILIVLIFARKRYRVDTSVFKEQYKELGSISYEEVVILHLFATLALLWILRADLDIGIIVFPGWSNLISWYHGEGFQKYVNDGSVAILISCMLFFIPATRTEEMRRENGEESISRYRRGHAPAPSTGFSSLFLSPFNNQIAKRWDTHILEGNVFRDLPWTLVLLFGGGFALAHAFKTSGLSVWVATQLEHIANLQEYIDLLHLPSFTLSIIVVMLSNLLIKTFTEISSNTATAQVFLPILGSLATALKIHPFLIMIPATLSCSYAFMFPVATPPNMIVFGSQRVEIFTMAAFGLLINTIAIVIVGILAFTVIPVAFRVFLDSLAFLSLH